MAALERFRIQRGFALLMAMTAVAFAPFAAAPLFLDDLMVIRADGPIATLASLPRVLTGRCILFPPTVAYNYYRPMIDALFVLEYSLFGGWPLPYHFTNYALHLSNVVLAWSLMRRLPTDLIGPRSLLIGLAVFALHPVQVESVLWIAARPGVLSLFWLLLSVHAALRFLSGRGFRIGYLMATGACFGASILSKEVAVAAVLLGPLLLLLDRSRRTHGAVVFAMVVVLSALFVVLNSAAGTGLSGNLGRMSFAEIAGVLASFTGFYLKALVLPFGLMPIYPVGSEAGIGNQLLGFGMMGAGVWAVGAWVHGRSAKALLIATGLAYGFGSALLPIMGGQFQAADRYLYQSMLGFSLVTGALCGTVDSRIRPRMLGLVGVALGTLTFLQAVLWTNPAALWRHCLRVDPAHVDANVELGNLAIAAGDRAGAIEYLEAAVLSPQAALPAVRSASTVRLAGLLLQEGRPEEAEGFARRAAEASGIGMRPKLVLAAVLVQQGRLAEAGSLLKKVQPTAEDGADEYQTLAMLCRRLGIRQGELKEWDRKAGTPKPGERK